MTRRARVTRLLMGLVVALSVVSGLGLGTAGAATGDGAAASATSLPSDGTHLIYEGDTLTLDAGPGQVVHGETDLPAGTELTVLAESSGGSTRFIMASEATVTKNGTFRTTFDLADTPAGQSMTVSVSHNGSTLASARGTVTECTDDCAAPTPDAPSASIAQAPDVTLGAGPGRPISGTTDLPPGAAVTVRVGATDGNVSASHTVTVGDDGRYQAVFDLSSVPADTPVNVTVVHDGSRLARASGTVVACEAECTPPSPPESDEEAKERNESQYDDLNTVDVTQGETARIELTFEPENVTLTIGGPQWSYALNASVRDGNDDDRAVVLFDTGKIGQGDAAVSTANASDSVSVIDERAGGRSVLDEGEYLLVQSVGPTTQLPDDNPETFIVERGTLSVADAPMDESGDESPVAEFGWPQIERNGTFDKQKVVRVRTDQTARIPITTDETRTATLTVGHTAGPYFLAATVRDGTGDERVVVVFNASAARENSSTPPLTAADEGDHVSVTYQNGTLSPGEYDTDLYLGRINVTDSDDSGKTQVVFGMGGQIIVAEENATPTMAPDTTDSSNGSVTSLGVLGLGGLLGALGIAFLVGLVEL